MPIQYARALTSPDRSTSANRHLGISLAFVAGGANAGAFLAVRQYTSHMTGILSSLADSRALGDTAVALASAGALLSFLLGAMTSAVMINFARRRSLSSTYSLPLLLEAFLLLCFGVLGGRLTSMQALFVPVTVMLLCFTMGVQNAVITKISQSEIRTTHMTGVITDLGIELGKLLTWNGMVHGADPVLADRERLATLGLLLLAFFSGGWLGALGFKSIGFLATLPFVLILVVLSVIPALDDLRRVVRNRRSAAESDSPPRAVGCNTTVNHAQPAPMHDAPARPRPARRGTLPACAAHGCATHIIRSSIVPGTTSCRTTVDRGRRLRAGAERRDRILRSHDGATGAGRTPHLREGRSRIWHAADRWVGGTGVAAEAGGLDARARVVAARLAGEVYGASWAHRSAWSGDQRVRLATERSSEQQRATVWTPGCGAEVLCNRCDWPLVRPSAARAAREEGAMDGELVARCTEAIA